MAVTRLDNRFDILDRPKSPSFNVMDPSTSPFFGDSYQGFEYLQFPHSPFDIPSAPLPSSGTSPRLTFDTLNLSNSLPDYAYSSGASFTTGSPARPFTPPDLIPQVLAHISNGELSSDTQSIQSSRRRGSIPDQVSPALTSHSPLPQARSIRYNPLRARAGTREKKRRLSKDEYVSDDDEDFQQQDIPINSDQRREDIRRQRIESEQRRRDELRDGYRRLKDVLPVSNQKSSKVSLLDRATTHIKYLEMTQQQLQTRLNQAEMETQRLRNLNETLMLSTAERHNAVVVTHQANAF